MKCQKCGKNEVNFHYSSNINGCVTETHLCSQCAQESGYDMGRMFDRGFIFGQGLNTNPDQYNLDSIFDRSHLADFMLPMRGRVGDFMPMAIPVMQPNVMLPFAFKRRPDILEHENTCSCGCGKSAAMGDNNEVDEEMSKRRELNMQMRAAVEKEDFEKAAELRDKIKELESREET